MDTLAKLKKSSLSFILMVTLIFSNFAAYTPVHAASDAASDAYSLIEAESFSSKSGANLKTEACPDGGQSVGGTNDGQYLVYNSIDFGSGVNGATKFSARLSAKGLNAGGNIEIRLDSPTGTLAGTLTVAATAPDNWNVYQTQSTDITNVTGVHDIYLVLKVATGKLYVANINWFQFSKTLNSIAMTTPPTKTVYRLGESLDLTGMVVTGTYIDGSTRVEEVRASDVSGFNSSTAAASRTLTVTVRGKTTTFTVGIMSKTLTSIATPAAITGVINGTAPSPAALGLPSTVVMVTDGGNVNTFVNWNVAASGYDTTVKTEQRFTVPGTVVLPSDIANSNNVLLSTSISVTVLAATDPSKDTSYKFSYMAFSDSHATTQGSVQDIALDNAMQDAVRNNAGSVSVVGDITDYGTDAQYDVAMNTINKYPQVKPYFAYGNHEVRWVGGIEVAISRFVNHTKMPSIYFDKWINDYHFIYLGSEADDKDGAYISDTQLEWLKVKLAEGASKDKPIFLFLHQPLENTVSMSHTNDGYYGYDSDDAQDQKIKDLVGQYPQSVLITGHLHDDIKIPGNLYNEQYFTMIRDGAIVNSGGPGAQALIFDIYKDKVVINGRDVNTRSTIASWTITNYTTDALSADTQAPTVPSNVTAKVVTDTMVTLEWDKATDNFNGNVGVIGYDVYNGTTVVGSTSGNTSFIVTGLSANKAYQFTVKARDEAGNASTASSPFNVTTLAYDPAAINLVLNQTVTTNGNLPGYEPSKAVDGTTASGSKWSSSTTGDKWLMVDLGQNYDIARWVVKHAGEGGETISLNTKHYKLQGSFDGTVWADLDSVRGNVSNSTDRYIPISTVRYVRLYITSGQNAVENGTSNIYEFEVYGRRPLDQNLNSITAPADITGVVIGTAKTVDALGLPKAVSLVTDKSRGYAYVTWNLDASNYDPNLKIGQTFTVNGTVTLPTEVLNPNNVPLTTSIRVTVNKLIQSATATSQETGGENNSASMAIDGDTNTIWHTKWNKSDVLPQSITLKLGAALPINKVTYLPRQSGVNGIITAYNVYVSKDGVTFTKVASGTWANDNAEKVATFDPTDALYVKLEATAGVNGWASAAEINVLEVEHQPPTTTDNAPSGWVNQDVTVTLSASDNGSGVSNTYYTVDDGAEQTGTTVVLSEEGVHKLVYWSVDKAGNVEQAHTVSVSIDKKAPSIAVTVPGDNSIYEDSVDLTPQIAWTDNLSGVDSSKTTVTLDTYSYQIGTAIPLYKLPIGQHTLVISSSDLVGNQVSKTVQFTTVTSIDSLKALVKRFANNKEIDKADIATNLLENLENNNLKGFMNDVKAQSGKHISSEAATYLLRDAQYLLTQK
ncbi:discoidin domain-containing protein [Paenibacillus phytorum]|nr:discoidin domain-containing protein [Paenibacillus phytorum]